MDQNAIVHRAYIALGSNVGDRISMIEMACREMDRRNIKVLRTSALYESAPMYLEDQGLFINGACEVRQNMRHQLILRLKTCLDPNGSIHTGRDEAPTSRFVGNSQGD